MSRRYNNYLKYSIWAWCAVVALIVVLALAGCGGIDHPEGEIAGPHGKDVAMAIAWQWANGVGGVVYEVNNDDRSMGDALSDHALVIVIPAWNDVRQGQIVARSEGWLHEVIHSQEGAYKTAGRANGRLDGGWLTQDNYAGTVLAQIYYKP